MKVTFALEDPDLYRDIKVESARSGRSVREIVEEALREWLERHEEGEDREAAAAALEEYRREGGVDAATHFRHLAAEVHERYGPADR
jgi:hypothetical protein